MEENELNKLVSDKAKDIVEKTLKEHDKAKEDGDKFNIDDFVKHQENCNDPDCPVCSVPRRTEIGAKIKGLKTQVEKIVTQKKTP